MFKRSSFSEADAKIAALDRSLAIIEFSLDGTILHANENFLKLIKYSKSELVGQHHRIFIEDAHARTPSMRNSGLS